MLKKYEGLFIFTDSIKDEDLEKVLEKIRGEITRQEGTIQGTIVLGRRGFSRPMHKQESGTYVRVDFSLAPDHMQPLLARLKINEDIFRVQFVKAWERREKVEAAAAAAAVAAAAAAKEKTDGLAQ